LFYIFGIENVSGAGFVYPPGAPEVTPSF